VIATALVIATSPVGADPPTTGSGVVSETFQNSTVPDSSWTAQGSACLTGASGAPPVGSAQIPACTGWTASRPEPQPGVTPGYLQLTRAVNNVTGSVLYNRPVPASAGVSMVFRQFQYGGSGADGIGFFLVDGSTNLTATGANGGSLGYAQKDGTQPGIVGGYIGVGLDAYGNFYNDGESRGTGCPVGQRSPTTNSGPIAPNVITVRGPGSGLTGYCWLNSTVPKPITNPNNPGTTLARPLRASTLAASEREVNVQVTPDVPAGSARIIVEIRYNPNTPGDPWVQVLNIPAPAGLPSTYKFGLSSSTGGSTDVHLIRGVTVTTINPLDVLQLEKQVDRTGAPLPPLITAGSTIPYQFTVTNAGTQPLENLTIQDDHIVPGSITCDRTTLTVAPAIGSSAVCKGSYVVSAADVAAGSITNIATAHANPVGLPTDVTSNPTTQTVPLVSSLTLQKSVVTPPPYAVGQQVTYSYLLTNTGGSALFNVAVSDNRLQAPSKANCPANTLDVSATMTCVATSTVRAADVGSNGILVNTAVASSQTSIGQQVNSNQSNGQINVFTDVGVTKTVDNSSPVVASNVTFMITATNHGPSLAEDVVVTDLLPTDRLAFVSATPSVGTYNSATGRWSIGSLTVGQSVVLQIVATVQTNTAVTNSATRIGMRQTDINPANDTASVTLNPVTTVDLAVTKSVDVTDVPVGDMVRFTIRVTNNGPSPATGVALLDILPDPLVFDPANSSGDGTYDPTTGIWTVGGLAVGATASHVIAVTTTALGTYTNLVALQSSTPADNDATNNSASATVIVRARRADLYITKGVFPETALVGDEVVYQITVGNKGPETVHGAFVSDTAPPGIDLSSTIDPNIVVTTGTLTINPDGSIRWDVGDLAVDEIAQATVYAVLLAPGTKVNTSTIDAPNLIDTNPADNSDTAQLVSDPRPVDIAVTKTVVADSGAPIDAVPLGDAVTFSVEVGNNGPNQATNVVLQDLIDPSLGIMVATPSQGTYDSVTGLWSVGTLDADQTETLVLTAATTEIGQHANTISLSSLDQADTDPSNNSASATVIVVHEADLAIDKTNAPSVAQPGDIVTFDITVGNLGPNDATEVSAHDPLPIGADIVGSVVPPGTTFDTATRVWTIGNLAVDASVTLQVMVLVTPGGGGIFTNTVVVATSALPDSDPTNNISQATTFVPSADIAVSKSATPAQVALGDDVTFVISVENLGPDIAQAVQVGDLLPMGLTFVSAQPSAGTYDPATGLWTIGDQDPVQLVPRAAEPQETLTIVARAESLGTFTNIAASDRTEAFPFDPILTNNQSSATVTVVLPLVDVSISKTVAPATVAAGDSVTFTMAATNAGPGAATAVVVTDPMPAGLTPVAVSDPACAIAGAQVTCTLGTLAAGATHSFTVTARADVVGAFTNVATISTANPDTNADNNTASVTGDVVDAQPPPPSTSTTTTTTITTTTTTVPDGGGTLPPTGSGTSGRSVTIAAALLAAGAGIAAASRRRRDAG
jgi:uncharacterized repeat protein (TIGR01451 family)